MEKKTVQVQIFGMSYSLKSDADEEYVKMISQYVDSKLQRLSESTSVKSQLKIAVLAALNIADELFQLKKEYEELIAHVENKSKDIGQEVDSVITRFSEVLK